MRLSHWSRFRTNFEIMETTVALTTQGLYSLSGKTSYRKISWSLEAARFGFKLFQSLWNLAGTSAALLQTYLSHLSCVVVQDAVAQTFYGRGTDWTYCFECNDGQITKMMKGSCKSIILLTIRINDIIHEVMRYSSTVSERGIALSSANTCNANNTVYVRCK